MTFLLIAVAGGLGATTRFVVDRIVARRNRFRVPLGTLVINITGSFALGILAGLIAGVATGHLHDTTTGGTGAAVAAVVGTGFCGGYTTFSTASVESARLWMSEGRDVGIRYAAITLITSVTAAALGLGLGLALAQLT